MDVTLPAAPVAEKPSVDPEIQAFLEGGNPKKYVVNIEVGYNKSVGELIVQEPGQPARREEMRYTPFVYMRDLKSIKVPFYGNDPHKRSNAMAKHQIRIKKLRVTDRNGAVNERLANGYCYQVFSDAGQGYGGLMNFFREGGLGLWDNKQRVGRFELTPPTEHPHPGQLYAELGGQDGCFFLYNYVTCRYEVHVDARFVNTRTAMDEQDENAFFIRLKAEGKSLLKLDQDFDYAYDAHNEKYVLSLLPEAEKPRKTRKQKDGSYLELPTLPEEIEALQADLVDVSRIDHPLLVARMPEVMVNRKGESLWNAEAEIALLTEEGLWGKVQVRERAVHTKERKRLETQNNKIRKRLEVLAERLKKNPSRKANPQDPRYTVTKLVVEYNVGYSDFFYTIKPSEQLLIQHGLRLFKGYDRYQDVHKLDFDLETGARDSKGNYIGGLFPEKARVFLFGIRDNRGYERVIQPAVLDDDESEKQMIQEGLREMGRLSPAIVKGFNSENFDWNFLEVRCSILGIPLEIPGLYGGTEPVGRKKGATLKLGGDTEVYTQTTIRGVNVIDVMHATRRVKAVNSDMERYSLKYVCQYEKIAKANRVYVEGKHLFKIWAENALFVAHKTTNEYVRVPDAWQPVLLAQQQAAGLPAGFARGESQPGSLVAVPEELAEYGTELSYLTTGRALVYQYLLDDLWETDKVDDRYNEDRFQFAKWMPTAMTRAYTMGGSTAWNLMMTAWSYAHQLGIPYRAKKYKFTGGLSRTFRIGKFKTVKKVDFSGLYPSLKLQFDIFPPHDVLGVQRRMLHFFTSTRSVFKEMAGDESLPESVRSLAKARSGPLKINNNSEFGSGGSFFYYWNYMEGAWETTCRGRQFLRGMVAFFMKFGCQPTILDTDGVNFEVPDFITVGLQGEAVPSYPIDEWYHVDRTGAKVPGFEGMVVKYNEEILGPYPYMALDLEADWPSAINISRKNYANLEAAKDPSKPPKIKFVGNSIKDNNMPAYIKDFVQKGLRMLLNDQGYEFVEYYYQHLSKIYLMQIPLMKIAKKGKVKLTKEQYLNRGTTKNGQAKARQAHMELIIQENLKVDIGEAVYFVATGTKKGQAESAVDKVTGKLMSRAYTEAEVEADPNLTVEYNVERYIAAFNAKVKLLLVCFPPAVRESLLKSSPAERNYYTEADLVLTSFENPKDPLSEFFQMEASEVKFWNLSGLDPYEMFADFTVAAPYDGHFYAHKLKGVQRVMEGQGRRVRCYRERYDNGDLVLGFERTVLVTNPLTGESQEVPEDLQSYFLDQEPGGQGLPYDNDRYRGLCQYRTLYGADTRVTLLRRYPLCEVVEGALVPLRMLYDAPDSAQQVVTPPVTALVAVAEAQEVDLLADAA